MAAALQPSNALRAAVKKASIGDLLHLAIDCRVYTNLSSFLPHWDLVRKGAGSAEALDGESLVSRQNGPWGLCGDRQYPPRFRRTAHQRGSATNLQNRFLSPCGAARFSSSFILWRAIRGAIQSGVWLAAGERCDQDQEGSEHQPGSMSISLTMRKEVFTASFASSFARIFFTARTLRTLRCNRQQDLVIITTKRSTVQQPREVVWWWQ